MPVPEVQEAEDLCDPHGSLGRLQSRTGFPQLPKPRVQNEILQVWPRSARQGGAVFPRRVGIPSVQFMGQPATTILQARPRGPHLGAGRDLCAGAIYAFPIPEVFAAHEGEQVHPGTDHRH